MLELERAREAFELDEALLYRIVESHTDGIVIVDHDGIVRFTNPAAARMFGMAPEELLLRPFGHPISSEDPAELGVVHRGDSETHTVEMRVTEIVWNGVPAYLASLRDITQRKRLEAEVRRAHKLEALGRLAGGIAHDVNNLLMGISGLASIALSQLDPRSPTHGIIKQLHESALAGGEVPKRLLAFSRGGLERPELADLHQAVTRAVALLTRVIGEDIRVESSLRATSTDVLVSENAIEQIVMNLAINARDAMPRGGCLRVETYDVSQAEDDIKLRAGDYIGLNVTDDGDGMTREVLARAFEPFFTTKDVDKGTGLGLSTVYGIARSAGGSVNIRSTIGEGTTVTVLFPIAPATEQATSETAQASSRAAPAEPPAAKPGATPNHERTQVLVLEDENLVRWTIRHFLTDAGYRVHEACSGEDALARVEGLGAADALDVIVSDVVMPGERGPIVVARLLQRFPRARVIFMSAHPEQHVREHESIPDSALFINKPFDRETLLATVARALAER